MKATVSRINKEAESKHSACLQPLLPFIRVRSYPPPLSPPPPPPPPPLSPSPCPPPPPPSLDLLVEGLSCSLTTSCNIFISSSLKIGF
ncbi:hypothetical protein ELR57_23640 [Cohnella sp. AR92]|nr:hypothetical protein ELR57_23640 [Cohnella sp. AR92]